MSHCCRFQRPCQMAFWLKGYPRKCSYCYEDPLNEDQRRAGTHFVVFLCFQSHCRAEKLLHLQPLRLVFAPRLDSPTCFCLRWTSGLPAPCCEPETDCWFQSGTRRRPGWSPSGRLQLRSTQGSSCWPVRPLLSPACSWGLRRPIKSHLASSRTLPPPRFLGPGSRKLPRSQRPPQQLRLHRALIRRLRTQTHCGLQNQALLICLESRLMVTFTALVFHLPIENQKEILKEGNRTGQLMSVRKNKRLIYEPNFKKRKKKKNTKETIRRWRCKRRDQWRRTAHMKVKWDEMTVMHHAGVTNDRWCIPVNTMNNRPSK